MSGLFACHASDPSAVAVRACPSLGYDKKLDVHFNACASTGAASYTRAASPDEAYGHTLVLLQRSRRPP